MGGHRLQRRPHFGRDEPYSHRDDRSGKAGRHDADEGNGVGDSAVDGLASRHADDAGRTRHLYAVFTAHADYGRRTGRGNVHHRAVYRHGDQKRKQPHHGGGGRHFVRADRDSPGRHFKKNRGKDLPRL